MYKKQIKYFSIWLILLTIMVIIAGCSSESNSSDDRTKESNDDSTAEVINSDDGTPKQGGEAVIAYYTDASSYDPILGGSGADHALLWPIYDTLISFNPELEPQPGLAESWDFPDDKTMVLHLREGVTFQDNTPFDAEAVKFNIERVNSEDSTVSDLKNVERVEVVDSLTVKLHLKQPDSSLLLALSDRGGMMVSPTAVKKYGEDFFKILLGQDHIKW